MIACGLDFGTSNSAIGVMRDGVATLAPIEAGNTLMPSAVFFDYETRGRVLFGEAAIARRPQGAAPESGGDLRRPPEGEGGSLRRR
jgi:molecular chaperone DnaK (HSP70)